MSQYYNPKRTKNLYDPDSKEPYKLSRSKIDLFLQCPRCFYIDRRLGTGQPPGYPFSLNSAVDALLKKEFDIHRANGSSHPLFKNYGINMVPFQHSKMDEWRNNFKGISVLHKKTNFLIFGAIDDIWIDNKTKELAIVDYKATSVNKEITLNEEWKDSYKRQMEIYQWLARNNEDLKGYKISDTGYFVYCNGKRDKKAFDGKLEFDVTILPYTGNDLWIEKAITEAYKCLTGDKVPKPNKDCDYCAYTNEMQNIK